MKLIAEIGNNHFGDFPLAKEMIVAASDSGAHLVKLQAFEPRDLYSGTMGKEFYDQCAFTLDQYEELIVFGKTKGIDVFYSIFSDSVAKLRHMQRWQKKSGKQVVKEVEAGAFIDFPRTFLSFPKTHVFRAAGLENAVPLYVSDYLTHDPELFRLSYLAKLNPGRPFGYSDHTVGIDACEIAVKTYGARVIEKHFTMEKNLNFRGQIFRDTVHSATPNEFRNLAKLIKV